MGTDHYTLGFVCVQNAGRSQMSAAFADQERTDRGLEDQVTILTGGTDPANQVHPEVIDAMQRLGIDISGNVPQKVGPEELNDCDLVVTMGCSTLELAADVELRDWALEDPHGKDQETVTEIRDEIQQRVTALFDELIESE